MSPTNTLILLFALPACLVYGLSMSKVPIRTRIIIRFFLHLFMVAAYLFYGYLICATVFLVLIFFEVLNYRKLNEKKDARSL